MANKVIRTFLKDLCLFNDLHADSEYLDYDQNFRYFCDVSKREERIMGHTGSNSINILLYAVFVAEQRFESLDNRFHKSFSMNGQIYWVEYDQSGTLTLSNDSEFSSFIRSALYHWICY